MFLKVPNDPFDLIVWLLECTGQVKSTKNKFWNRIMAAMGWFGTLNSFLGPLLYAYLTAVDFQEKTGSVLNSSSGLHVCTKFFNCYLKQATVKRIIEEARSLWHCKDIEDYKWMVKDDADRLSRKTIKAILVFLHEGLVIFMMISALFTNIGKSRDEFVLPYPNWLPLDSKRWFLTHFIWEMYTLFMFSLNVSVDYALLFFLVIQASSHMKILSFMLESKNVEINAIVRHHQRIIRLVNDINQLYSGQLLLEITLYGLQTGARGFLSIQILKSKQDVDIGALAFSSYITVLYIVFSYLLCLSGHEIMIRSEQLYISAYQNSWYELSIKDQKSISLFLCMSGQTLKLHYRHLMEFNMERYATIVQAMYSYMTLLMRMEL